MNAAAQAGGKNLPIFSSASFTDSAAANKYLNAIIKFNCKKKVRNGDKQRVEVEFMEAAKCIFAWGRFLGSDCRFGGL